MPTKAQNPPIHNASSLVGDVLMISSPAEVKKVTDSYSDIIGTLSIRQYCSRERTEFHVGYDPHTLNYQ